MPSQPLFFDRRTISTLAGAKRRISSHFLDTVVLYSYAKSGRISLATHHCLKTFNDCRPEPDARATRPSGYQTKCRQAARRRGDGIPHPAWVIRLWSASSHRGKRSMAFLFPLNSSQGRDVCFGHWRTSDAATLGGFRGTSEESASTVHHRLRGQPPRHRLRVLPSSCTYWCYCTQSTTVRAVPANSIIGFFLSIIFLFEIVSLEDFMNYTSKTKLLPL